MSDQEKTKVVNATPLGLLGFGLTCILLNLTYLGVINLTVVVLASAITIGGISQVSAGYIEFKMGNTFSGTAFVGYGFFWLSLVIILANPLGLSATPSDGGSMGVYLLLWGIYTVFMFIGTLKSITTMKIIFATLAILFILLAIGEFTGSGGVVTIAAIDGIICGAVALYTTVAMLVNGEHGKTVLPV